MENYSKNRIFLEEILEIIPCGVSLRTFSPERVKKADKVRRSLRDSEKKESKGK